MSYSLDLPEPVTKTGKITTHMGCSPNMTIVEMIRACASLVPGELYNANIARLRDHIHLSVLNSKHTPDKNFECDDMTVTFEYTVTVR